MKNTHNTIVTIPEGNLIPSYQMLRVHGKQEVGEVRAIGNLDILKQKSWPFSAMYDVREV